MIGPGATPLCQACSDEAVQVPPSERADASFEAEARGAVGGVCGFYQVGVCRYGLKLNHLGTAGFGPWLHLPGFHLGYLFLTHSHVFIDPFSVGLKEKHVKHPCYFDTHPKKVTGAGTQPELAIEGYLQAIKRSSVKEHS